MLPIKNNKNANKMSLVLSLLVISSLITLFAVGLSVSAEPKELTRGDFEVVLSSDERDKDTGDIIPLEHTVIPGQFTSYQVNIRNIGKFYDTYDLEVSGLPASFEAVLSSSSISLHGNTSTVFFLNITVPYTGVTDGQKVTAQIEAASQTDPLNSSSTLEAVTTLDVDTGYSLDVFQTIDHTDVDMDDLDKELKLQPGEAVVLGLDVNNLANVRDDFHLNVTQSEDWDVVFSNYEPDLYFTGPANQEAKGPTRVMLSITAPTDAVKGETNDITIKLISSYNTANSISPAEMAYTVSSEVDYTSHLLVETVKDSFKMDPNATISTTVTVTNIGMLDIEYSTPLNSFVENGGQWKFTIPTQNTNLLEPGDSMTYTLQITSPITALGGTVQSYEVKGRTSDEADFITSIITCEINTVFDLDIVASVDDLKASPGSMVSYHLDVKNTGNSNISLDMDIMNLPGNWKAELNVAHVYMDPGEEFKLFIEVETDSLSTLGDYEVGVRFHESREGLDLDLHEMVISISEYPDLVISSEDIQLSNLFPREDELVTITFVVENRGTLDAEDVYVRLVSVTGGGSRPVIGEKTVGSIPAGENATVVMNWQAALAADILEVEVDPFNAIEELDETNNFGEKTLLVQNPRINGDNDRDSDPLIVGEVAAIIGATAVVTILAVLLILKLGGKKLSFLVAPLYTKLRHDDVLKNEIREEIYDYVLENPGTHFRTILTDLHLSNGTLSHHLNTLEKQDYIKSERDGSYRRYYPVGRKLVGTVYDLNPVQKKIMESVAITPGMSQKEVAAKVGISQPTAHYHLTALRNARLVELRREGKTQRVFIVRRAM